MNIGVDIDDTIVNTTKFLIKYADKYVNEKYNKKLRTDIKNIHTRWYLRDIYKFDNDTLNDFFEKYYKNIITECEVFKDAAFVLNNLKANGHNITFITARTTKLKNCDTYKITSQMLDENNILYDNIIFDTFDKLEVVKENNIDLMIDDTYDICLECCKNGIKTILMNTHNNSSLKEDERIKRVYNWKQIYDFIEMKGF